MSCIIGLTATPCRADGRGLGGIFNSKVECPQIRDLIDLVATKVYAPTTPDLKGVHVRMGDYVEHELAARMDQPKLVGDIVTHWHRLSERRKTVVFASSVAHSIHLRDEFVKSGVRAEHIDGKTDKVDRDRILKRLSDGDLELVTNCMVLTEGWDQPDVGCLVLARPTKSMGLFRQMVGRAIRTFPGKDHALVLDHAGATFQHGFIEEPVAWTLDPNKRASAPVHEARAEGIAASKLVACSNCDAVRTAGKPCPECGHMPKRPGEYLSVLEGELAHLQRNGTTMPQVYSVSQKMAFYQMLLHVAHEKNYQTNWAGHKYRAKFGVWPPFSKYLPGIEPNAEVRAWIRHLNIAYAKSRQKAAA